MLEMVDIEYIRKLYYVKGWSIRKIHRNLGYARQTIRKVIANSQQPKYEMKKPRSSPIMDPYREVILKWLEDDRNAPKKQRHTSRRIYHRLVEEHAFAGNESTVRRYVRKLRGTNLNQVYIPLTADWGEQAQVDWGRAKAKLGDRLTEVCLFCLRMRASRVPFVWAFPTEKLEAFLSGHRLAFEWMEGVPRELVYDNPKTAVVKILKGPQRQEHQSFSSLKAHYLFESIFCSPGRGNQKGAVENLIGYVRRNTMVPMPELPDIEALNHLLLRWCTKEREKQGMEWEQEKEKLLPLPPTPFRCSITRMARVNSSALINYERVRYSVPCRYIKQTLRVEAFTNHIEVWDKGKLVARHERSYRRQDTVLELSHYLEVLKIKPRAVMHAQVVRELPEVYAAAKKHLRDDPEGYRELCQILLLNKDYTPEQVVLALKKAVSMGKVDASTVRQLIVNEREVELPQPARVPEALSSYRINPTDTSRYDRLLGVRG